MSSPNLSEEYYRLFVAVGIPERIKRELAAAQAEMQKTISKTGVTWTRLEQVHVTLKFLGNVPAGKVDPIKEQLARALSNASAFELRAEQVGAFPDARFPRVLWAGITDIHGTLEQIHQTVEITLRQFTTQDEEKSFQPHATLGRIKHLTTHDRKLLSELLSKMSKQSFGEWRVNTIELMRSQLSSEGAVHSCIAPFELTAIP